MKNNIITQLEELLTQEAGAVATEVRALHKEYQKLWTTEFEKAKQEFIDEGGKAKEFDYVKSAEDQKLEQLFERFNKLKKDHDTRVAAEQEKHLSTRQEVIAKIKDLSALSDNVGAAIKKLNELQAQWKEIGPVSPHKYKEIQADYSKAVEDFYYNLSIYGALQEHDRKRNFELKSEVLEKVKHLLQTDNIKESERLLKVYRNDWEEIGPVPTDKWEQLKHDWKTVLDEVYAKIKGHYNAIEDRKEQNLKNKQSLIEKAQSVLDRAVDVNDSTWKHLTEELLALQNEWKSIGQVAQKENERIWIEFRSVCDQFFEKKKGFYNVIHEKYQDAKKKKLDLIQKAEALKDSHDWQKTSQALIKLQEDWKKIPTAGNHDEPKLFGRFRSACNHFFDTKKAYYEAVDASYEDNLKKKEEILTQLNAFSLSEDSNANREQLKHFSTEWNAAGMVPMKEKKRINDAFYNKLDELYEQMNLNRSEKLIMQFKTKLERLANSENAFELLRREYEFLRKQMDEINSRIRTYENNLGFFKNSKGTNDFIKEIEQKIDAEKQKIQDFQSKRTLVNDEINKLRD